MTEMPIMYLNFGVWGKISLLARPGFFQIFSKSLMEKFFLEIVVAAVHLPRGAYDPQICSIFNDYLNLRQKQYGELLTWETIVASLCFICAEPDPVETIKRAINRQQKVFKQFLPIDTDTREKYRTILPKKRYAVRTSRAKRENPDSVTDTVFIPRDELEMILQQQGVKK